MLRVRNLGESIASATEVVGVIVPHDDYAADIATILDGHGRSRVADDMRLSRVVRCFGWDTLIDDALAMRVDAYEANTAGRVGMGANKCAIAAGRGRRSTPAKAAAPACRFGGSGPSPPTMRLAQARMSTDWPCPGGAGGAADAAVWATMSATDF